ncbi:30S ribosomal protein S9 [Candidatus Kaiserbacteria bacterium]|nr:MAG: 30S ribosomal protein S9 [Candidatus Kaiserbacteria bacterium]
MATKQYIEGIGRRKTATARVRVTKANETRVIVNEKALAEYFTAATLQKNLLSVLETADAGIENYEISAHVQGGGLSSQSDAIRLGIARALLKEKAERRIPLKKAGFLKRDPRAVERKKFGLKKARKSPQWSKR